MYSISTYILYITKTHNQGKVKIKKCERHFSFLAYQGHLNISETIFAFYDLSLVFVEWKFWPCTEMGICTSSNLKWWNLRYHLNKDKLVLLLKTSTLDNLKIWKFKSQIWKSWQKIMFTGKSCNPTWKCEPEFKIY